MSTSQLKGNDVSHVKESSTENKVPHILIHLKIIILILFCILVLIGLLGYICHNNKELIKHIEVANNENKNMNETCHQSINNIEMMNGLVITISELQNEKKILKKEVENKKELILNNTKLKLKNLEFTNEIQKLRKENKGNATKKCKNK